MIESACPIHDRGAERRQIRILQIVFRNIHVESVPQWLRPAVHGIMFRRRHQFEIFRIVALKSFDELHAQARGQKWILAEGFHAASPARIAIDVDIRRPECKPREPAVIVVANRLVVLGAPLNGDRRCNPVHQRRIPRRRQADRLRKIRRKSVARHSVQRLIPPVVCGNIQPRDRRRNVLHLAHLFFERHAAHQVFRAVLRRQRWIQVRTRLRAARVLFLICCLLGR